MSDKPLQKRPQQSAQSVPGDHSLKRKKTLPDAQSKSFISDQSMWEILMDTQEEASNQQLPLVEHSDKPAAAPKILTKDSRAETIPIKKRRKTTHPGQNPSRNVQALIDQGNKNKILEKNVTNVQKPVAKQTNSIAPSRNPNTQRQKTTSPSRNVNPQTRERDLSNVHKKLEQERLLKYLKIPALFFVKRWTVIVTAILFFGLGYYIGSTGNNVTDNARKPDTRPEIKTNPSNPVAKKRHPVNKPKPRFKEQPKVASMVPKPQIKEAITVQPAEEIEPFRPIVPQQFDGIDITISEQTLEPVSDESDDIEIGYPQSGSPIEDALPITKLQELSDKNIHAFNNKKWEIVIKTSNEILSLQPSTINALINRSVAYTELGLYDLAINDCILAIAIEPKNPLAYNNRGYAYEKMGRINSAIADYNQACELGIELSCKEVSRLRAAF